MNQAPVLGEWRYSALRMPIHMTYALDLKHAHSTAVQLVAQRTSLPDSDKVPLSFPLIHTTPLIREQHFGIAEGKLWLLDRYRKKKQQQQRRRASAYDGDDEKLLDSDEEVEGYDTIRNRHDRFTSGESLDDLALRAEDAVERLVWPHLDDAVAVATITQIPVPVRIRMGWRSTSMVAHGKMERSTSKSEADSGE